MDKPAETISKERMDTAGEAKDGHVNIDMKQLMSAYEPAGEFILSSGSCIFKTPSILSRHNEKAYLPNAFSFGPWHYGKRHLKATQAIKYKYLEDILRRFPDPDKKLAELEAAIAEDEDKARQCYAGDVGVSKDEFVKLLVLDGCFIVEFFRRYLERANRHPDASGDPNKDGGKHPCCFIVELFRRYLESANRHSDASGVPNKDGGDPDEGKHPKGANRHPDASGVPNKDGGEPDEAKHADPVYSMGCMRQFLLHDLILLENQIPWFVLERLFNLTKGVPSEKSSIDSEKSLLEIALLFFKKSYLIEGVPIDSEKSPSEKSPIDSEKSPSEKSPIDNRENHHIISLFRNCMILKKKKDTSNLHNGQPVRSEKGAEFVNLLQERPLPSARKLKESGIKFERAKDRSILDIRFEKGVLKIPRLFIHETTETLFRNIISFEQCYPGCYSEFTSYAKFMDNLVDKDEDMEVLIKKGVIYTWLEPEAATGILNKLYQDAFFNESFYDVQYDQVNKYCRHWWPKWRAFYVRNYFSRPWAVFSQIFAFLVLSVSILNLVLSRML